MPVVIFGSAASFVLGESTRFPRDIDVVVNGSDSLHDGERVAREWANAHGLPADLPIDAHRVQGPFLLPTPVMKIGQAIIIQGEGTVTWREVHTVPALIRTYHMHPEDCGRLISEYMTQTPKAFCVEPGSHVSDLDVSGTYSGDGVDALRRAVTHTTPERWSVICSTVDRLTPGLGTFLERLVREDIPAPMLARIRAGSAQEETADLIFGAVGSTRERVLIGPSHSDLSFTFDTLMDLWAPPTLAYRMGRALSLLHMRFWGERFTGTTAEAIELWKELANLMGGDAPSNGILANSREWGRILQTIHDGRHVSIKAWSAVGGYSHETHMKYGLHGAKVDMAFHERMTLSLAELEGVTA